MCAIGRRKNQVTYAGKPITGPATDIADAIPTGNDGRPSNNSGGNLTQTALNLAKTNKQKLTASDNYQG
jgi:hypothetical protein